MNKREAKRFAWRCVYNLLKDHNNEFLNYEGDSPEESARINDAWDEVLEEIERKGWGDRT